MFVRKTGFLDRYFKSARCIKQAFVNGSVTTLRLLTNSLLTRVLLIRGFARKLYMAFNTRVFRLRSTRHVHSCSQGHAKQTLLVRTSHIVYGRVSCLQINEKMYINRVVEIISRGTIINCIIKFGVQSFPQAKLFVRF